MRHCNDVQNGLDTKPTRQRGFVVSKHLCFHDLYILPSLDITIIVRYIIIFLHWGACHSADLTHRIKVVSSPMGLRTCALCV